MVGAARPEGRRTQEIRGNLEFTPRSGQGAMRKEVYLVGTKMRVEDLLLAETGMQGNR